MPPPLHGIIPEPRSPDQPLATSFFPQPSLRRRETVLPETPARLQTQLSIETISICLIILLSRHLIPLDHRLCSQVHRWGLVSAYPQLTYKMDGLRPKSPVSTRGGYLSPKAGNHLSKDTVRERWSGCLALLGTRTELFSDHSDKGRMNLCASQNFYWESMTFPVPQVQGLLQPDSLARTSTHGATLCPKWGAMDSVHYTHMKGCCGQAWHLRG